MPKSKRHEGNYLIYKNMQIFAYQVLQECSSWVFDEQGLQISMLKW